MGVGWVRLVIHSLPRGAATLGAKHRNQEDWAMLPSVPEVLLAKCALRSTKLLS